MYRGFVVANVVAAFAVVAIAFAVLAAIAAVVVFVIAIALPLLLVLSLALLLHSPLLLLVKVWGVSARPHHTPLRFTQRSETGSFSTALWTLCGSRT